MTHPLTTNHFFISFPQGPRWSHAQKLKAVMPNFPWPAVEDLEFNDSVCSRGKALVLLKDQIIGYAPIFAALHDRHVAHGGHASHRDGFVACVRAMALDGGDAFEETELANHFYEACGYPEDDDDAAQVAAVACGVAQFAAALVRVANMASVQLGAADAPEAGGLAAQLRALLGAHAPAAGGGGGACTAANVAACATDGRDPSFFHAPDGWAAGFVGGAAAGGAAGPRCFLDVSVAGGDARRVVVELDVEAAPDTAYNFHCLCTGARGEGEITGTALSYKGNRFHRVCNGFIVQAGDIVHGDGSGGESVFGGAFPDETLAGAHAVGTLSMANDGPGTNTSQFFVVVGGDAASLDGEHVAFGRVVEGLDALVALGGVAVDDEDAPTEPCVIVDCGAL